MRKTTNFGYDIISTMDAITLPLILGKKLPFSVLLIPMKPIFDVFLSDKVLNMFTLRACHVITQGCLHSVEMYIA